LTLDDSNFDADSTFEFELEGFSPFGSEIDYHEAIGYDWEDVALDYVDDSSDDAGSTALRRNIASSRLSYAEALSALPPSQAPSAG
jgi:hypothetical protein